MKRSLEQISLNQPLAKEKEFKWISCAIAFMSLTLAASAYGQTAGAEASTASPTQPANTQQESAAHQGIFRADAAKAAGFSAGAAAGQPGAMWIIFLSELKRIAHASPELEAESVRLEAQRELLGAERGDLGLSLSGSHTRYPDGGGSQNGGSFTNLEEYSEARISLDLMHLLARRGSKVDSAAAQVEKVEYELELKSVEATVRLMEDAVTAWSLNFRREALDKAVFNIRNANRKLEISESAGLPEITKATPSNVAQAIILNSEIRNKLKSISPLTPKIPNLPPDFSELPLTPPDGDQIFQLAKQNPGTKSLQAESRAFREEAEGLRGNGFELSLYGGYVIQTLRSGPGTEEGTQYGATIKMPIGSRDAHKRRAAELQAHAANLEALSAVRRSQRSLVALRDDWAKSVASLNQAQEHMRQQARLLESMEQRASSPQSGRAPEPWEVDIQAAKFWNSVANVWEVRAEWMKNALTWGLLDPAYLQREARPSSPGLSQSLCAPFASCSNVEI